MKNLGNGSRDGQVVGVTMLDVEKRSPDEGQYIRGNEREARFRDESLLRMLELPKTGSVIEEETEPVLMSLREGEA